MVKEINSYQIYLMPNRIDKINELIREKLSQEICNINPDQMISISDVDTSKDLSFCNVYINVLNDNQSVIDNLNKHSYQHQQKLSRQIKLRKMPKIRFFIDRTESEAEKISNLLNQV